MYLLLSDHTITLPVQYADVISIDLSRCTIAGCIGCFSCWVKTPGKCIIRDDATRIYPLIAKSSHIMYISRIRYGTYDIRQKMLERSIPIQQPFIHLGQRNASCSTAADPQTGNRPGLWRYGSRGRKGISLLSTAMPKT
ncbi:MAG: hypothetical protein ACLVJ6_11305 [Merdibacter sp.]